jgi:hypothetical protein
MASLAQKTFPGSGGRLALPKGKPFGILFAHRYHDMQTPSVDPVAAPRGVGLEVNREGEISVQLFSLLIYPCRVSPCCD